METTTSTGITCCRSYDAGIGVFTATVVGGTVFETSTEEPLQRECESEGIDIFWNIFMIHVFILGIILCRCSCRN